MNVVEIIDEILLHSRPFIAAHRALDAADEFPEALYVSVKLGDFVAVEWGA